MTEPCAVVLHGVQRMPARPGDTAAVFGAGPIGTMVAQWLRIRGASEIFVVDVDPRKLKVAAAMGFTAVGLPATFLQAVRAAARSGDGVFLGNIRGEFRVGEKDFSSILRREITIHGT